DHHARTATARVARRGELAVGSHLDCAHAAEIQIASAEADYVLALELDARLAVDVPVGEMEARRLDCVFDSHATTYYVRDHLQDRAAQALRAGRADDEARAAVLEHD